MAKTHRFKLDKLMHDEASTPGKKPKSGDESSDNKKIITIDDIRAECMANVTLTQTAAKRFFKTAEGNYAAGDLFLGIIVPTLRKLAAKYQHVELQSIQDLLKSKFNEERLLALFILIRQYQKGDAHKQEAMCQFYLKNLQYVDNWNLVDSSAHHILGHYLFDKKDRSLLQTLAKSDVLWQRRISIVATLYLARNGDTSATWDMAELLLSDKHDLIHKAVGWILREAGKRDKEGLLKFLSKHEKNMPKTMLRYAKEQLVKEKKQEPSVGKQNT